MYRDKEPKTAADERRKRLAVELRANLLRRKAQDRARRGASDSAATDEKKAKTDEA
jgi:hypothetical protein